MRLHVEWITLALGTSSAFAWSPCIYPIHRKTQQHQHFSSKDYTSDGWYSPSLDHNSSVTSTLLQGGPRGGVYRPPKSEQTHWSERRKAVEEYESFDEVWMSMRSEAKKAAEKEALLVSFMSSTILNQRSLESSLSFHLANKLTGPSMMATQIQALFLECLSDSAEFRRSARRDMVAVRDRDPACTSYHDALLYFKGYQALQTHRVSHWLHTKGRYTLAHFLQSRASQEFQIDIHPAAILGEGVFLDHGTGVVIGETARIGDDSSILHQVTLGGSGAGHGLRHPNVGKGVLIGAGSCLLGPIKVGDNAQIGAGSLVLEDVPAGCVAVGVPARVLGKSRVANPAGEMRHDVFAQVWGGSDI